nr:adenylate/guanylate cyclase domain-containing protein [[Phormidium] sp. ETS-05]
MLGGEISEVIGHDILEIIEPEYRDLVWANTIAGYEKPYEVLALKKDGLLFPAEIEEKVIPYEGRLLRVAAIRDITKRKQAEGALRESEARFRALVEQAADAFVIHDMEGRIIDVNQSACESLGYTRAEILGLSVADIEDNFESEMVQEKWRQLVPGVPTTVHGVHRGKDGTTFPVEVRVGLVDAGVKKLILALCRDVTERKLAEDALLREREKSERLLLNILPEAIAEQLKENQRTIAEGFGEVTVLFADIVGFTKLAAKVSPTELVHLLNDIFSRFDLLADRHGLEKIKTIGDAYMVVGGLPVSRPDHAAAVAAMALDMQQEVSRFSLEYREPFSIRIGINTGPVVAGVIGRKKFIYDLWGDTVNVASRMESHGIPGEIQVTESTYMILRDKFAFQHRGAIRVKCKGEMNTDLLTGWLKPN